MTSLQGCGLLMRNMRLQVVLPTDDPANAFEKLMDYDAIPALAPNVCSVRVHPWQSEKYLRKADWEVNFNFGVLRWTGRESVDRDGMAVEFEQIEGDLEILHGAWRLNPTVAGCEFIFTATYDFGIESIAKIIDPVAERVITRSICEVLAAFFGETQVRHCNSS
ncbi:type II toxin-antitoxin system RatA family toxin [Amycolatopsis sp. NPDC049868]|uniref:type II toxin-antitoxin system RatA family toxin n=1 Tax=Amycolatopsis sp. NPDC049868 TaxID=3363934 RepID=UPI0037B38230